MTTLLTELRHLIPARPLGYAESLRLADLQAARLLYVQGIVAAPVPESVITSLPRLRVIRDGRFSSSGSTTWNWSKGVWQIVVNEREPDTRIRFSICHEFKHLLDEPYKDLLYPALPNMPSKDRQEAICDHFAAALLMPAGWVKHAYRTGYRDPVKLAQLFDVSLPAMQYRLRALGLLDRAARCLVGWQAGTTQGRSGYERVTSGRHVAA